MHNTVKNLLEIENNIKIHLNELKIKYPKVIAVSKTFKIEEILPLMSMVIFIMEKIKFRRRLKNGQKLKKLILKFNYI